MDGILQRKAYSKKDIWKRDNLGNLTRKEFEEQGRNLQINIYEAI